jgi:heme-degrading monooxygenase HmoA
MEHKREENYGRKVEGGSMIKGIIGYKMLDYKDIEPVLMQLRSRAMQYPGFVDAVFLVGEEDRSVGVMISTWKTMENWRIWVGSEETRKLLRRAGTAAIGMPRITAYRIMPTEE